MTSASISMYDKSMLKYKRHEKIKRKKKETGGTKVCMACGFLRSSRKKNKKKKTTIGSVPLLCISCR